MEKQIQATQFWSYIKHTVLNRKGKLIMYSINKDELLDIIEYEKVRNDYRKDIIAYKKNRRFTLGPNVTIIFENKKSPARRVRRQECQ